MPNGEGFKKLYPPLKDSDFLKDNVEQSACLIKFGISGILKVNDLEYNIPMPASTDLTHREIANLLTYISSFSDSIPKLIEEDYIKKVLLDCSGYDTLAIK